MCSLSSRCWRQLGSLHQFQLAPSGTQSVQWGIKGSLARASVTFICWRSKGEVKQPRKLGKDGVLVVNGQGFEVVEHFCYLGDVLDEGGPDLEN